VSVACLWCQHCRGLRQRHDTRRIRWRWPRQSRLDLCKQLRARQPCMLLVVGDPRKHGSIGGDILRALRVAIQEVEGAASRALGNDGIGPPALVPEHRGGVEKDPRHGVCVCRPFHEPLQIVLVIRHGGGGGHPAPSLRWLELRCYGEWLSTAGQHDRQRHRRRLRGARRLPDETLPGADIG